MKPLGKAMKIAHYTGSNEQKTLTKLLDNYRDTPDPATGIPPSGMMCRNTFSNTFPSKAISDSEVELSKAHDHHLKEKREQAVNSSKYKKPSDIKIGDFVILKNFNRKSKFDPIFLPDQYMVTDATDHGRKLVVKRTSDNQLLIRHPDDVKPFQLSTASTNIESNHSYPDLWKPLMEESSEYDGWYYFIPPHQAYVPLAAVPVQQGQQYQINIPQQEMEQNQADAPYPPNQQVQIHHPVQEVGFIGSEKRLG